MPGARLFWAVVVFALLAALAWALGAWGPADAPRPPYLTSDARDEFARYVAGHPAARRLEERCSGVPDIANNAPAYFAVELREKEHSDVARRVAAAGGILDVGAVRQWIAENAAEMAAGKRTCD